jgi:hypothetical protein
MLRSPLMKNGKPLTIDQFAHVLQIVGAEMVLIGGQAVAIWAREFAEELNVAEPVLSKDIDFWGDRQTVISLARRLNTKAHLPGRRDFTLLSGIIRIPIEGELVSIDVLHAVPGVDEINWDRAATIFNFNSHPVRVLDPISLIASKLHNLRHFDQSDRRDAEQLRLSIRIARIFLARMFNHNVRTGLGYVKRLIEIATLPANQPTLKTFAIKPLQAVPIETIRRLSTDPNVPDEGRDRLANFLAKQWPRVESAAG